jgi:hypothetical protein
MNNRKSLLGSGLGMVMRNKRYLFWFWLLNVLLAEFGVAAFRTQASQVLDNSLYSGGLVHGFSLAVFGEMLSRPEFGPTNTAVAPAVCFAILFFLFTALFLPGVFQGYTSNYRLPRDDFFRACGRNLWRFIRLMLVAGLVMGIAAAALFSLNDANVTHAGESTNELLPFEMKVLGLAVIFLVMTILRIWFDLAEADVVLSDQSAVRKSIGWGFRYTFRGIWRLLASYVLTTAVAAIILLGGIFVWRYWVAPQRVGLALLVSQFTLLLLLIPRFWQRAVAASYWQKEMLTPVIRMVPSVPDDSQMVTPIALPGALPGTSTPTPEPV